MTHELGGSGKGAPRLRFDRTQVVLDTPDHRAVIPLDQIVQVDRGQEQSPTAFLALPAIGVLIAVGGVMVGPPASGSLWWVYLALGAIVAIGGILGYLLMRRFVVRIESSSGELWMEISKDQMREAAMFVRDLMNARTQFLEGIYEEGA